MNNELPTLKDLLERDADKIAKIKSERVKAKLEPEWVLLAEFGLFFGWQAVQDVREDRISFNEMNKLLAAARQSESVKRYNYIMDTYSAVIAVHDKGKSIKQTLKTIRDSWQT